MEQFYFLSVLVNITGGLLMAGNVIIKTIYNSEAIQKLLKIEAFLLIFSIIAAITGLFKIISPLKGDVYVIGDIFPAAASFTIAIHFFSKYLEEKNSVIFDPLGKIEPVVENYRSFIGIACIAIAILHFLFPQVLFI
jgi:hypothetical protein